MVSETIEVSLYTPLDDFRSGDPVPPGHDTNKGKQAAPEGVELDDPGRRSAELFPPQNYNVKRKTERERNKTILARAHRVLSM